MNNENIRIGNIPAIICGAKSDKVYIYVHGKMSRKEEAENLAQIAEKANCQVLSFDLPEHGERIGEDYENLPWNAVEDLKSVEEFARCRWSEINLYACSLGAYYSLLAYNSSGFGKCLFLSPLLDMRRLIENMMLWFNVSLEELKEKKVIETPIETLRWDYYQYAAEHPVNAWNSPTAILYGSADSLTARDTVENFTDKHNCDLTVMEGGEHYFHTQEQLTVLNQWLMKNILL